MSATCPGEAVDDVRSQRFIGLFSAAIPSRHLLQTGATQKVGVQPVRRGRWQELRDRGFPSLVIRAS